MWGDCTLTEMLHLLVGCGALHTDGQPERRTCFINCIKLDIYTPLSVQRFEQALSFYSTALYLEAHCLTTHTHTHTQTDKHMHVQTRKHKGASDKALGPSDVPVLGQR